MIIKYRDINDGNAVKEYNGSLLRLTGADGGVVLMSASALTLTGTNGTVTAGQTLDLSTLLTVPSALAGKTVSWSKASGSAALTLSGHTVTAASGATASDSADFVATVAGITATVTVTATAAAEEPDDPGTEEPEEPSGAATVEFGAALTGGGTRGFAIALRNDTTTMSSHKHDNTPNERWIVKAGSRDGSRGSGAPNEISLTRVGGTGSISAISATYNSSEGNYSGSTNVAEIEYVADGGEYGDYVWIEATSNFTGNTGTDTTIYYKVTLEWT